MNEVQKSIVTAGVVVAAVGAAILGANTRNNLDLGQPNTPAATSDSIRGWLASRDNQIDVPAADYFYELSDKLEKEYVEPVTDEQKLASGAIRGMVGSLGDPKSSFMAKDEFQAFLKVRQGEYEGIGVDVALQLAAQPVKEAGPRNDAESESSETSAEEAIAGGLLIPKVVVVDVVPGGPAARAGVRPGDVVYEIDSHWVANGEEVAEFRNQQQQFLNKKIDAKTYNKLRTDIRKKTERALMPSKVREKLTVGTSGAIHVTWLRDGAKIGTDMTRSVTRAPGFADANGVIRLPLDGSTVKLLKPALQGKSAVTLDLRHNANGDFNVMREVLAMLAPSGEYGYLATDRKGDVEPLTISQGASSPPKITLLVDRTTAGAAEILALALSGHGRATLSGGTMGEDRTVRQVVQLPDGSGYTLVTSVYRATKPTTVAQGAVK